MSKRNIILICSIFTIIILSIFIYFIINEHNRGNIKENLIVNKAEEVAFEQENIIPTINNERDIIYPNATLQMKQLYKKCGHTIEEDYTVPEDIVNMTKEEVENYYTDWNLEEFSNKKITIYKEYEGICDEHFIIRNVDGVITIYRINNNNDEIFVSTTDVITKYLPEADIKRLNEGIEIIGKKDLKIFLQDFE